MLVTDDAGDAPAKPRPEVTCRFCGSLAVLERRLRKVEPEVEGAPLRLYLDAAAAEAGGTSPSVPWVRSMGYQPCYQAGRSATAATS
ncbi:MAG: hypothetical protein IPF66_14270 [Holophagales bacterium]|nr:hypothetical protein [Holophagales bacterium]